MNDSKMKHVELEDGQSADIVSENIEKMKELFPDAFSEGGVNFDTLRQLLGDASVLDEGEEKYGLNWHGKKKARQIALTPSTGTLLPCPEESVDWDTTQNLFIEGDNLEVLKLLQKSYTNKVQMIFIDPPYNKDKDFIYPDKWKEGLDEYLRFTDQADESGVKTSDVEKAGRLHTNWLNMIYPRLRLAQHLLSRNGCIFITIDDDEVANLREVCDEVFGGENFVAQVIWEKIQTRKNSAKYFSESHDYVLCYAKSKVDWKRNLIPREDNSNYTNPDNDPKGSWKLDRIYANNPYGANYTIKNPITGEIFSKPQGKYWRYSEETINKYLKSGQLIFSEKPGSYPNVKRYLSEVQDGLVPTTIFDRKFAGDNGLASRELTNLLGIEKIMDYPKPTKLIHRLLQIGSSEGDIILDFFAGSGSTGHAVIKAAIEDRIKRRFICVQIPEPCSDKTEAFKAGHKTIAKLAIARLKAAGITLQEGSGENGFDTGFKVFKLSSSNIQAWNPDRTDLEESLLSHEEHLVEGRTEQDVLYELLLKRGVDLAVPIESREVSDKNIYSIGYGVLFACLDETIAKEQVEDIAQAIITWYGELAPSSDTHVFFRDSAFRDDISKTNMAAILEQNGITHVRSL
jgi:adenine-specific DNA-methyltransferase